MAPRRVFILYSSPLFARGVGALLSQVAGLEVVGMAPAGPEPLLWEDIQQLAPDVMVLEQEGVTLLAKAADALPGARLVTLSLIDDRIRAYECRGIHECGLEGLIKAVLHHYCRGALGTS